MKQKLLLHCCCAPCSSAILEHLKDHFDITLYFYNPCITDKEEYYKRANELEKFKHWANIIIADFEPEEFFEWAELYKDYSEGGTRCSICFSQRLRRTAEFAKENGFNYFSTTLTISPYKNSAVVNSVGTKCGLAKGVMYMPFDFGFLYIRSLELCKEYDLYEQDYCGCEYSKN